MADSQGNPGAKRKELQFRVLDALYTISDGYKHVLVSFENLYERMQAKDDNMQESLREVLEYLRDYRLIDSKALGTVSITHEGIKEYESAILNYPDQPTLFPSIAVKTAYSQSKKDKVENVTNQREAFLQKAYKISNGSIMSPVNLSDINEGLHYDNNTLNKIYFYYQDEGVIKPFAIGGVFTITRKGIEQVEEGKE